MVEPDETLRLKIVQATDHKAGLASLAGGWEGSEALADILARRQRSSRWKGLRLNESPNALLL